MSVFEPLLPRRSEDDLMTQEPLSPTFSPLRPESQPRLATPMVSNMGEPPEPVGLSGDFSALVDEFRETAAVERRPSFRDNALHRKGVNWATPEPEGDRPYQSNPGFYELDYDPRGKHGVELGKGSAYVDAANVFGRQFNRAELERDSEGRKLLKLMEAQRTGAHQEAGFWKGLSDWNLGNTPWLGWMMDIGSTVSETVAISKAMRKMQNGEAVTDHEAIAVRRFMLQQELEGQRSTAYQIGSTIRSSIPFVVEIAAASAMTAAAAKVGAAVGTFIGGPVGTVVGGAIGAVGGFVFGGGRLLSKALTGAGKKAMTKVATNVTLKELAEKTFEQGITKAQRKLATKIAAESTGVAAKDVAKAALQSGRARALEAIGRNLAAANPALASAAKEWTADQFAAYAAKNATTKEIRKRTLFEASKWTAESFKDVADIAMDTRMARQFLVNKDTVNLMEQGWVASLERAALGKSAAKTGAKEAEEGFFTSVKNYWKERASIRQNIDKLTPEKILEMKKAYLEATMDKALGRPSAQSAVAASISQSLGGAAVHKGYADEVAEAIVDNATRSFMMKYRGKGFVNGANRLARWVGDGIMDGMLRWDTSIFHGAGTMARSGSVLGGRMAAMKEALKASFVEAPVRGAMQLGVQIPTWPVISMATGNAPGDFVVRGQLGTQLTALQTGDREMMDNARAIAIGSGLVEYISESAGRGFNVFAEGVAAPCLKNAPFVKMTKEVGSYMSRKLESVFGTAEMMKAANKTRLADAVARHLGRKSTELLEKTGQALPAVSKDEIMRVVSGARGVGKVGEVLQRLGLRSEKDLIKDAMVSQLDMSRRRAGIAYFVAHNMLEKGWTPQKMAQWMQSVGYDGVISEMMEERYGGFFQGLLGLDDSPSDATARDRWSAAMKGLFPDPHQLLVEAASFSFPALTQLSMNHMYSRLGAGIVSEVSDAARTVSHGMRTVPAYTMPVASEEGAAALAAYQAKARELYEKATVGEGGEEAARAAIAGRAQAVKSGLADGSLALDKKVNGDISNKDVSDGEMEKLLQEKAQRIVDLSNTSEELEVQLRRHQADLVFGKDGAEAIRRIWRKDPSHMDSVKEQALGKGSEYARHVENVPTLDLRKDADVGSVASEITATLPFVANDAAMTAEVRERLSVTEGVQVNEFSEDYAGDVARNLGTLGDKWLEFKYNLGKHQWWGRRALMRATGILDAITTGNLELAARNPVQWAIEEAQLPKQLMSDVGQLRERSVQAGREIYLRRRLGAGEMTADEVAAARARPLADEDLDLLEEFKKAGEESYRTSLREYAQLFLTARNVIAVSRGDIEDAALRVVAHDHREEVGGKVIYRYGDKTTEDFRSQEFRAAVANEMAPARDKIVKALARLAASDAVAINTHSRFGNVNTTSITFSYDRAMRYGNTDEVVAAIRSMPAFRNMRAVYDVSDGGHVKDSALGRVLDVGELLRMPTDGNLDAGSLRQVMFAMGRYYDQFTEEQNQQAAQQYLTRMRLAVENTEPLSFEFRDGTEAKVTTEYGVDDKGNKVVTLSVNGVSVTAANVYEATKLLEEVRVAKDDGTVPEADVRMPDGTVQRKAGVLANWRQVAILQNDSISSRDATSLALLLHGTRERAREAYERFYGVDRGNQVPEELYPPQLRKVGEDRHWQYDDDEQASRDLAKELRSGEEGVRAFVRGNGVEGDPLAVGYERAAELMLERYGITRSKQDAAATDVYRGEASYSIRPNGIAFGDTVYLQSDYYSGGDSEMLLRSAFSRAIFDAATKKGKVSMPPSEFVGVMQEMDRAFTKAAEEAIAELQDKRPDLAQRLRDALDSLPSDPGRVSPARMGAIAAAVAVFSDERGANEFGNGFLFGPELAYIADRARLSPWTQLFISTMDEALGGYGFFAKDKPPMAGIRRYIDAFAPSGEDLVRSRSTALFSGGNEAGKKEGIVFQGYGIPADISAAGLASGVSPILGDDSRTRYKEIETVNVPLMIGEVAANCRAFAEAYEKAGGTLDNATMYRMLKHALDEGGETVESGAAPSIGSGFGGTSIDLNPQVRAPLSSEVVPDDVAYGLGRGLQFLSPALFGNPAGGVGGRRQASRSRAAVRQFLFERGVYADNVERIWAQFMNAAGAETAAGADAVDAVMDEAEWNELAEALSEGSGNQDIFFDAKRQNAAIENKDLMELGRQWRFVFPSEGGAFTQIVARLFNEVSRLSAQEGAPQEMKDLSALFNVLRSPRKGEKAGDRIAAATGVWNDSSQVPADLKNTDYVLAKAVAWLHGAGHDDLALVLNGIRNIPAKGKRRAQALALIGYMSPLDTNFVSVGYDGLGSLETFGSANLAAVSSTRATVTHMLSRVFPYRMGGKASTSAGLMNCVSALDNLLLATGTEEWLAKVAPGTPFEGKTIAGLEAILKRASEGGAEVGAFRNNLVDDDILVAFANVLARRLSAVADAVDYVLGPDNELTYALRNPDLVSGVVQSVRRASGETRQLVANRLLELADACVASEKLKSRCPLLSSALLNPAIACIQIAVENKGGKPSVSGKQYKDIGANGLTAANLYDAIRKDDALSRILARTDIQPQGRPRSKWMPNKLPGGVVNSLVGRVFGLYASSAPRSVARMNGVRSENIEDSSQVTAVPASPAVMAAAIEDRLLANLKMGMVARSGTGVQKRSVVERSEDALVPALERAIEDRFRKLPPELDDEHDFMTLVSNADPDGATSPIWGYDTDKDPIRPPLVLRNRVNIKPVATRLAKAFLGEVDEKELYRLGYDDTTPRKEQTVIDAVLSAYGTSVSEGLAETAEAPEATEAQTAPVTGSSEKSVLDDYLARGGRFLDGSRLVVATAGAKLEDGTVVDKAHLSVAVARANMARFERGDSRNGYFELYHGEKPTVYSVSLPKSVMQKILDGIHSGAEWATNKIVKDLLAKGLVPEDIDSKENRGHMYDALFSVVASAARCDQIESKRTQVLMAQGVPFSTYRDTVTRVVDGNLKVEDAAVTAMDGKTRVAPGLYCDILVSGTDAAQNLGMYLNHGLLIEAQRAQATNPMAVSFKNHLIDWFGSGLFKGQGHDPGIGMHETDVVPVAGTIAEALRIQRRELEETLGIKEGTLDLPEDPESMTDEEKAYRESAVRLAEAFFRSSTTLCTDVETLKSGPFSTRCGFRYDLGKPFAVKAGSKELAFTFTKGRLSVTVDGNETDLSDKVVVPEDKAGLSLATMLPAIAYALGKKELTAEDVGSIEAEWKLPDGNSTEARPLKDSGLFQSYGVELGDKVSVVSNANGGFRVKFFTRSMNGQVMANSDASSKPTNEHPAATNWARDLVANSGRLRRYVPGQADFCWTGVRAINVARSLPYVALMAQPGYFESRIKADRDLYAAWKAHPNSQDVQEQLVRRANNMFAKAMKPYVGSMHAVLMGSGIKASTSRNADGTYDVEYSYSAGVTDYDRDCFRDARVLTQEEKEAFGVGRSYASGQVNVDSRTFRYGWHLADDADMSPVVKFVDGSERGRERYAENLARLEAAYGPASEDMKTVAYLATYIEYFDEMKGPRKEAAAEVLGKLFTDYTGKHVGDNASCDLMKVSFSDLFLGKRFGGKRRFDLAAFEFAGKTHGKKVDRNGNRTIYLGGAFFAGDRRPSGNFEAAGGLIRVQAPVLFDRSSGRVDSHALYILPPLMNSSQGSDTDGDSATGTVMVGRGFSDEDREVVEAWNEVLAAATKQMGPAAGEKLARGLAAADALQRLMDRYPDYFEEQGEGDEKVVLPSARFHQLIGNVLLQEEIDNYRLMPNETQTETFGLRDVNREQGGREVVYDFGLVGRSPVGTQAVSDDVAFDPNGGAAEVARSVLGKDADLSGSYYKVFKRCIDRLSKSTIPDLELLDPRVAAYLSGCAADANGARGVMVSLQAALEHLAAYSDVDPRVRQLAPALFEERDGYRPLEDFIGHLDKISNALFDVVKDLFAPRAGWQKGLLNLLVARLVSRANEAYAADRDAKFDDEWFFAELVGFAKDLHASDTSLPSLVAKANAFYDNDVRDDFLVVKGNDDTKKMSRQTLLGAYNTMILGDGKNVAHTAFRDLLLIRDGRVQTDSFGKAVTGSGQAKVRKGLMTLDRGSGEFVPAHGADVVKSISGLLNGLARALRMTRDDFADEKAYENAVAMGWRPASDLFPAGMADRIADALQGKVDGRTATTSKAEKIAVGMQFLAAGRIDVALERAEAELRRLQTLTDLQLVEDGLSPDTSLQRGGTKASGLVDKMEASAEQGAALGNQMAETYASARMRLEDAASERNPLASDRGVSRDLDAVEAAAKGDSDWTAYLMRTGQRPLATTNSDGWPENDGALLFMMAAGMAADRPSTGDVQANRLNLSHLLGCVRSGAQKFGSVQYGQLIHQKFKDFAAALNDLVEEALNNGTAKGMSKNVVDMLTMLRPNVRQNTVSLALRASADAAKVLQAGFAELAANQNPVGGGFSGAGLAACIQLSMCASSQFDPAKDSDVRANVSAMFGREVDEWERWGAAVPQSPVLRQLCRIERGANGYDLFHTSVEDYFDKGLARKVAKLSGMPGVATRHYEFALKYLRTPFDILRYVASSEYLPEHDAYAEADASDPAFLPGGDQYKRVTSVYADFDKVNKYHPAKDTAVPYAFLAPSTRIPGVKFHGPSGDFDTLEMAVNDEVYSRYCEFAADKQKLGWLVDPKTGLRADRMTTLFNAQRETKPRLADDSDRELYEQTGFTPAGSTRKNRLNLDNIADEVIQRAWTDYGEQFSAWARSAAFDGGETLDGVSSPWAKERLSAFVEEMQGDLEAPSIGQPDAAANAPFMVARMERGGFFEFLKDKHPEDADRFVANPEANIRAALEHVFGDWSKETGCKVERVTDDKGVPLNLLKVTRKVKDKNGVHEVATYISFGDYLPMKAANMAYRQAILDELNRGSEQKMTMEQFMSLTEEEQVALANSLGMRVKGESVPGGEVAARGLNTKALMALSGLVRLSDVSDYHTLFHEYFHQMLDFYRKTGICTEEDMAALLKKYRTDDGRFDEEAAADAFAEYVGGGRSNAKLFTKLSGTGGDEDKVFRKFKHTAQAFLAGALAYDARGVPAFMKMMISADFSDREMAQAKELAEEDSRTLERMLLGEDVAFGSPHNWESAEGELAQDMTDLARAAVGFRQGTHSIDEVKALAAKFVEDGKKPANRVTFEAIMHPDRPKAEAADGRKEPEGPTLAQRISDPSVPVGDRVSLLFKEALARLGRGSSESKDLTDAVNRFRDLSTVGATDGSDMSLMVYTARRALGHVCDMLGLDIWKYNEDGTKELNDLGRQLVSDEKVANFLVRLVHEYSVERMSENDYELPKGGLVAPLDDKSPAQFASADYVMGRVLAGVLPSEWTKFCRGRAETAKDYFLKAAEDLEARAAAIRSRFPGGDVPEASQEEARRMELQAATLRHRATGVVTFVNAVVNGEPLKRLIPAMQSLEERKGWTPKQAASNYYGYILQFLTGAARMVRQDDGSIRYEKGSPFGFQNEAMDFSSKYVQEAVDAAAKALGVAQVVRRYVQEAGVGQPAPGENVDIPVTDAGEPAATPAPEGVMEPDLTPQLVLQLPGSWQASDLQKQFYGGSFRDMMTDVSLNAAVEETNRMANRMDFYLGANCMEGESVNEIEEGESDLGLGTGDQEGLFTVEERNRHSMRRVAAVRGHFLGLVNRAAKTRGRPLTREDVNLIHYVGQMVACMANGHGMYTGYDIPYVDRNLLDRILADVKGVEDLEAATQAGGAYSPEAVAQRVDGHLRFEGRPSNLDVLLSRILVGVPRSVLGWVPGKKTDTASGSMTVDTGDGSGYFRRDGIYCRLLEAFYVTARQRAANGGRVGDADFHKRVTELLVEAGIADKSAATGRVVLVIPAEDVKRAWEAGDSIRTELIEKGGRRAELLDMDYLAECVAAEANRLNRIAGRSRWLADSAVGGPLSGMARGLWFEAGTGHHQAVVDHMKNARELFRGDVSPDEKLRSAYGGLQDTLASHARIVKGPDGQPVKGPDGREMLYGDLPAFELGRDGQLANISNRQLMYLGRLLGLGRRIADVDTFVRGILAGNYTKAHTDSIFGFDIRPKMTVFEFDRLMFDVLSAHLVAEAAGRKTPLTSALEEDGLGYGRQELVDVYELHGRLQAKIMDDMQADSAVRGRVCSMSEQDMFRTTGKLGSSKSATERLRSMAESITHAERFRGCLAQMLTTVGTDGAPNFVVMPKEGSEGLLPDEFWQATARFVLDRLRPGGDMVGYDATKSGFENMRDVAKAAKLQIRQKSDKKEHARYHSLPPDDLGAGGLFEEIWCADDEANDDVNVLTKFASGKLRNPNGSEAEGYLRQLFGSVVSPSVWSGWKKVDRVMSYSKAASVGLSAFFAVATRFESPIAACGFWNTVMGYSGKTAKLTRWLAGSKHESVAKAAEYLGFAKNMPYLADFLDSITSDDPSIQYMRELCDLINMPLTDSIMNPLTSKQGAIDADIDRISRWLAAEGHVKMAAEVRSMMKAAFHNPGEYAFSNVLNGVKMAVVAQTMFRLRKECEAAGRPFDPVRELRKHSAYINAEIGGIQPERYAFLTPGMQQLLRVGMFSYQWTLGAWVAGTGEVVSDMLFGGHHTTAATRQRAFIRWLRMLGIVKVGVPVFMQLAIKSLATALVRSGMVGDPDDPDDKDPLGIDDMPWLCFFNESKVGSLAFDVTPLTKLLGRSETLVDIKNKRGAYPFITAVAGTVVGAAVTRKWWGALAGGFAGRNIGAVIPASEGVGRGANTTGRRRQYMHFGKQNDEFWRWFTDGYTQATNKLSIPLQKVVEAFFGSTNGQNFGKKFDEKSITDRFFTTSLDPNESALANFVTGFMPFSAASVAGHPDTGVLGMFGPVNQGTSKTRSQKEIRKILTDFVRDDRHNDPWSFPGNRANLKRLCALVMKEARMNGLDPDELLTSALGQVTSQEYIRLFDALPKTERDTVDARKAKSALRALYRVNRKRSAVLQSLKKKYKAAGVDWTQQRNAPMRAAVKAFLSETARDPWVEDEEAEALFQRHFSDESERTLRSVDVQQDRKGGEAFSNFLATDDVPETLFGIPVVSGGYTQEDLEFFKRNPKAAGFYDLGDEGGGEESPPEEPPPEGGPGPEQGAQKAGKSADQLWADKNPTLVNHVKSFEKLRLEPYEDVGGHAIGYGAHVNHDGAKVTKDTGAITAEQADTMLARDLYARRAALAKSIPNWKAIPGEARQALLDVSMGRDDVLSKGRSPGLHEDLAAAGPDAAKLLAAVKKHYYSYRTSERPEDQAGLEARRVAGGKAFFGEDFSYDGMAWDPTAGFVKKGGK